MSKQSSNLDIVKGRPMLHWVGKKPIERVNNYPAQLVETYGAESGDEDAINFKRLEKEWHNLILHGDNKEILSTLIVNGFRGKVDLIYIDPPFDSAADYVRKIELRGIKQEISGEGQNVIEQVQYTDIWANDQYLQFMYERLMLLRELLSEKGSIYLHCDWHKSHHLRFLLDEVFGEDNCVNEIIWYFEGLSTAKTNFRKKHNNILFYSKSAEHVFNASNVKVPYAESSIKRSKSGGGGFNGTLKANFIDTESGKIPSTVWEIPDLRNKEYPTQKPDELIERIVEASSNASSIVLDCFGGSGVLAKVAQKLNRRWIIADLNKGAIQTASKRLQDIIKKQNKDSSSEHYRSFRHYRVNNYCFQKRQDAINIIIAKYGIEVNKTDAFFDGQLSGELVKICDLSRPANRLDIQAIKDELGNRQSDKRNVKFFVSGAEAAVINEVERHNKSPINKIKIVDIQRDGVMVFESAEASIEVKKEKKVAKVKIKNYLSPTILKRLDIDRSLFGERITDFRAQIDVVLIDNNYNGKVFNIHHSDIPEKKEDFVSGEYEIEIPNAKAKVAVKIIDMVGEEFLFISD